jgi:DNA polymerase-3 subunit epsilon
MKILYFDCETTGTDPVRHDIIQFSGMMEVSGVVKDTLNIRMKPFSEENIDPRALEVTGLTKEQVMSEQDPEQAYRQIIQFFGKHIDKFDRTDKFYPAGYNVKFDLDFLYNFFKKNKDDYFGSYCNWKAIDGLPLMHYMEWIGAVELPDYKLSTVCAHYGISIDAHDAQSDIEATRELLLKLRYSLKYI